MKILLEERLCAEAMARFEEAGAEVMVDASLGSLPEADGVILTGGAALPETLYDAALPVKVIGRLTTDNANFDLQRATRAGRMVLAPRRGEASSVADYALSVILRMARERKDGAIELKGKTIGFLGFPPVAGEIAQRANAFGMSALCYEPDLNRGRAMLYSCEATTLVDLFVRSDFVVLLRGSAGLVGKDEIQLLKKGAGLICLAQPSIFRWDELKLVLDLDYLSYFAIDLPSDQAALAKRLKGRGIITVNEAANTREARTGNEIEMAEDMVAVLRGEQVGSTINVARVHQTNYPEGSHWCRLAYNLGCFMGQRVEALPKRLLVALDGTLPCHEQAPIVAHLLEGFAAGFGETTINAINATLWAEENGIFLDVRQQPAVHEAGLRLVIETADAHLQIAGTVHGEQATIVQVDDYLLHAQPREHVLLVPHINRPGLVGQIGTLLGEKDVNIAEMVLGHKPQDKTTALMWIHIEEALDKSIGEESKKLASVLNMEYIHLSV